MIPLTYTIALALLSFGLGCLVGACLVRRVRHRWTDEQLCPHRKQPEPFIGKWTPAHAMRRW